MTQCHGTAGATGDGGCDGQQVGDGVPSGRRSSV
eukprot:CAMPEP_0175465640 /NCGR_PEP_ID=MMETSP0095-20121207/70400_1 /TAXON_ID=311494 /ORGANISM="Alexandrium monilatum, Strain CCMP3105" /LENGTH=33 /DNA_ID= /DNA_START= /DNA_END= /DNA_ORIENTATION=